MMRRFAAFYGTGTENGSKRWLPSPPLVRTEDFFGKKQSYRDVETAWSYLRNKGVTVKLKFSKLGFDFYHNTVP